MAFDIKKAFFIETLFKKWYSIIRVIIENRRCPMTKVLESHASAQTSYVGEVGSISSGNLSTAQMSQANVNLEIPDGGTKGIVTLDFDEIINDTAAPEADGAPSSFGDISANQMSASHDSSGPDAGGITGSNAGVNGVTPVASGGATGAMSASSVDASASVSFDGGGAGSIGSGDAGNGSHGDGSAIGGASANGIDGRMVYADDAVYQGPEVVTSDTDINIEELLSLSPDDLKSLIGQMTPDQYRQFIDGVEKYYQNKIDNLSQLLENLNSLYNELDPFARDLDVLYGLTEMKNSVDSYIMEQVGYVQTGMKNDVLDAAGITLEQFLSLTEEEKIDLLRQYDPSVKGQLEVYEERVREIDQLVEEQYGAMGIHTYAQLQESISMLKSSIAETNQSILMLSNYRDSAQFDYLLFSSEYADFETHPLTDEELQGIRDSLVIQGRSAWYDFNSFHEKFPDVSPLDYLRVVTQNNPNPNLVPIRGLANQEALLKAITASPYLPDYEKTFQFLFAQDPEQAYEFLKATDYQLNNVVGQIRAQQFLASLYEKGEDYNFLKAILNELGVSGKGLLDGLGSFGDGVGYTIEAICALFTNNYNRQLSVDDYEKMYILYGLMSTNAKLKNGLIVDNGDGTYSNNTDPNVNPYGIIDFSTDYAGLFLSNNYEISQGIGNMLPSIALSYVCPAAGMWALGISAGGNAYHNAMVNNNDYYSSVVYGIFNGFSEAVTERLFGGIPFLSDVKVTSWKTLFQAMGREFTQESLQGVMDLFARRDFLGEELPDFSDVEAWKEIGLDLLKQGGYGAITAGILQSPNFALSVYNLHSINQYLADNNITTEQQQKALEQLRAAHPELANLTDADIRMQYGQQLAAQAMINKTAQENHVSVEVANVMLSFSVDAVVATFMIEHGCTLEEALSVVDADIPFNLFNYSNSGHVLNPKTVRANILKMCNGNIQNLPTVMEQLINQYMNSQNGRVVYDIRLICREGLTLLQQISFPKAEELIGKLMTRAINDIGLNTVVDPDSGIIIRYINGMNWNNQLNTPEYILSLLQQLPPALQKEVHEINFYDTFNPYDFYWEREYQDHDFYSAATGGDGVVNFWAANQRYSLGLLAHEIAHTIDRTWAANMGVTGKLSESALWAQAAQSDYNTSGLMGVSEYARTAFNGKGTFVEDFADAIALYYTNPNALDQFPARKAILEQLLPKVPAYSSISTTYDQVYDILVDKYGEEEANWRLKQYYETGNINYITRDGGARDMLSQFTFDEFRQYLDQIEAQQLNDKFQAIDLSWKLCFQSLVQKYGYDTAIAQLQAFIDSGDISYITRLNGARDSITYSIDDYRDYIRSINNGSLDISNLY